MIIPAETRRHFAIQEEIASQSDRGAALVAAAYVEERLRAAIRALCTDTIADAKDGGDTVEARLFEGNGAVATFSAKINVGFAMGFFGPVTLRDLHLVRKIRNHFAHEVSSVSFADAPVSDWCRELRLPDWCRPSIDEASPTEPRPRFMCTVRLLHNFLFTEMVKRDLIGDKRSQPSPQVLI